ncbi:hypothetical protein K1719_013261 [Acacia pycnantha]|nr:hypothetical protein K1719_013261 [Acacia pycnantha]
MQFLTIGVAAAFASAYRKFSSKSYGKPPKWIYMFITGSAGTGKTLFLQEAIKRLRILYKPSRVSITASTGIAACAIKGQTLHSFAER